MSKILKLIRAQANELVEGMKNLNSARYTTRRDERARLYVTFEDGEVLQLPLIPFRNYQEEAAVKLFLERILRMLLERPRRSGKEVETWNLIIQGAVESPGLYMMVYPSNVRARAVLWDGAILMPDNRSVKFLEMIPKR